eukprot:gene18767-25300_t
MGFEWTVLKGEPRNQPMHRYKISPKCCNAHFNKSKGEYQCNHTGYFQVPDRPYGNGWHGGPWGGPKGRDPGTFNGSFIYETI